MAFEFIHTTISGVVIIQPKTYSDDRGDFAELYKYSEFASNGIDVRFVQTNYSRSKKHVVRGLHYQIAPHGQAKLVRAVSGSVFDVAVDIRKDSPTFGKWISITLTAHAKNMLFVPEGLAHGFCALEENTELEYNCSSEYSKEHERGLRWNDPAVGIHWPIESPIIIDRDATFPTLEQLA